MDWIERLVFAVGGGAIGWTVGVARDRRAALRKQQIAASEQLHERVLEVASTELFDGKSVTLAIRVQGGSKPRRTPMDSKEIDYQARLGQWRDKLREEEDRARLWIDAHTVCLVSSYFLLMMQCSGWEEFGQGILTEDREFRRRLRAIFGRRTDQVLRAVVTTRSGTKEPWLVDCVGLSNRCLSVIQRRIRRQIAYPALFRLGTWVEAVIEGRRSCARS